ncbi:MAG: pectate lyase [Armatimonadota bacterium]|jgi:PelA/Pel-15E family pectate lyase
MRTLMTGVCLMTMVALTGPAWAVDRELVEQAHEALRTTVTYLVEEVAVGGGYAGSYLADLSDQWGEGSITATMNWVQPPGSPSTGMAFLRAWEATGDPLFLDAAKKNAESLVWGQLACGGWDYNIDFSPEGEQRWFYRRNVGSDDERLTSGRNVGTMDDNVTQHATRLLIAVDRALTEAGQPDDSIHEAAMVALDYLLEAQKEGGAWPQRFPLRERGYQNFMTFNDGTIRDCLDVMMIAYRAYGDQRYYDAVVACGDFIIKSQLPEPQPIWAQQYDYDLQPAWARRMEPASACAGESAGVLRMLPEITLFTGDTRFLDPIPAAAAWYERSRLEDGRWARFYELKTNMPLMQISMERTAYWLSYEDHDTPDHYAFKGSWGNAVPGVAEVAERILEVGPEEYARQRQERVLTAEERLDRARGMEDSVRQVLDARTENGVWLSTGGYGPNVQHLNMRTVQQNMGVLSNYLALALAD